MTKSAAWPPHSAVKGPDPVATLSSSPHLYALSPYAPPAQTSKGESHAWYSAASIRLYTCTARTLVPACTCTDAQLWREAGQADEPNVLMLPSMRALAG